MSDPNDDLLAESASLDPQESPTSKRYEDITLRLVEFAFSTGRQEFVLYPEDEITWVDGLVTIIFHTMGGRWFQAYTTHLLWNTYEERAHRREIGVARPDPADVVREQTEILQKRVGERRAVRMQEEQRIRESDSYLD